MLNTVRFGAVVDTTHLEKFKEAALVSHIPPVKGDLDTRQETMSQILDSYIDHWKQHSDRYPEHVKISFDAQENTGQTELVVHIKEDPKRKMDPWKITSPVFHLGRAKWKQCLNTHLYQRNWISPEKHLKNFLDEVDAMIRGFGINCIR